MRDFQDLGFTAEDRDALGSMTGEPHGIILVTGPTGSGKTTTLYSTLKGLATPEVNVCSIEDPIEMIEPAFNQMQVQPGARRRFRGRRADAAAPGSGHHHGRRDPRPRYRRHGRAGCADRSPRAVDAAHERCAHRRYAAARPRRSRLLAEFDAARRDGAAARPHALSALQDPGRAARRSDVGDDDVAVARRKAAAGDGGGRLSRMPDDRLSRPHRPLRDHADDAGAAAPADQGRGRPRSFASRRTATG